MQWNHDYRDRNLDDAESLAHTPSGGRGKQVVLGIVLPVLVACYAARAWIVQEALWLGGRTGGSIVVQDETARAMAVCYLGIAIFCHARWFWGLVPAYKVFTVGTVVALALALSGCGAAFYYALW
jgi:hypothetical protein